MPWNNPLNDFPGGFLHRKNGYGAARKRTLNAAAPPRRLFGVNDKKKKVVWLPNERDNRRPKGKQTRMLRGVQMKRQLGKPSGAQRKMRERKGRKRTRKFEEGKRSKKSGAGRLRQRSGSASPRSCEGIGAKQRRYVRPARFLRSDAENASCFSIMAARSRAVRMMHGSIQGPEGGCQIVADVSVDERGNIPAEMGPK
jgi:hypothetical protein